jgi:hypothetical protein
MSQGDISLEKEKLSNYAKNGQEIGHSAQEGKTSIVLRINGMNDGV